MATRTSAGSGKWSAAATWDTGVPGDGDTAVIAAGHTVVFDVDQSAFATGVVLIINGVLDTATDFRVSGDGNATIAANAITGLTRAYMTSTDSGSQTADASVRSIFASVVDDGGGHWHIDLYKETGRTTLIAHTGDITGDGAAALSADGGSGVGGSLTIANWATIAADTDIELSAYYYWRAGAVSVTFGAGGQWKCGTAGTPYPTTHRFVANLNGAREITLTDGTLLWYCAEPTTRYVAVSGTEAVGQTELSVDTDVTAELDWCAGAEVRIDNVNRTNDSEARTIDSVAAGAITVTAGLTAEKIAGTLILLITRNIRVIGHTGTGRCIYAGTGSYIGAEIRPASGGSGVSEHVSGTIAGTISASSRGMYSCSYCTVSGVVSGCTSGLYGAHSSTLSGLVSGCGSGIFGSYAPIVPGLISGCVSGFYQSNGGIMTGTISGCSYAFQSCWGGMAAGTINNCASGINASTGVVASTAFTDCSYAINNSGALLVGATFTNTTWAYATDYILADTRLMRSYDHNGSAGDTRSYAGGGYGATDATTPAPGFADSHKFTMTSATFWNRMEEEIVAKKDVPLIISIAAKNGATGLTGRARVELIEGPSQDPYLGGTPAQQYITPDDTDWHIDRWFLMPTADTIYTIRGSAKHGSQNAWVAWRVEPVPQESA